MYDCNLMTCVMTLIVVSWSMAVCRPHECVMYVSSKRKVAAGRGATGTDTSS